MLSEHLTAADDLPSTLAVLQPGDGPAGRGSDQHADAAAAE